MKFLFKDASLFFYPNLLAFTITLKTKFNLIVHTRFFVLDSGFYPVTVKSNEPMNVVSAGALHWLSFLMVTMYTCIILYNSLYSIVRFVTSYYTLAETILEDISIFSDVSKHLNACCHL